MMKYFLFLVLLGGMVSCNSKNKIYTYSPKTKIKKIGIYKVSANDIRFGELYEICKDSAAYVDKDETTKKRKIFRYCEYWISVPIVDIDSLNRAKKDTAGKIIVVSKPVMLPSQYVISVWNINVDSLLLANTNNAEDSINSKNTPQK